MASTYMSNHIVFLEVVIAVKNRSVDTAASWKEFASGNVPVYSSYLAVLCFVTFRTFDDFLEADTCDR